MDGSDVLVLSHPVQCLFQLRGSRLKFKAIDDFVNGNTGEGKYAVGLSVSRGVAGYDLVVSLEVFGKDVSVQDGFGHWLEHAGWFSRAAPFFIGQGDDLVKQCSVFRATEESESLLEHGFGNRRRCGLLAFDEFLNIVLDRQASGARKGCKCVSDFGS